MLIPGHFVMVQTVYVLLDCVLSILKLRGFFCAAAAIFKCVCLTEGILLDSFFTLFHTLFPEIATPKIAMLIC